MQFARMSARRGLTPTARHSRASTLLFVCDEKRVAARHITHRPASIITHDRFLFPLFIYAVRFQEIIGKADAYILRAAAAVGAIEKYIALQYSDGCICADVKVDAVAYFGYQSLFGAKHPAYS